MNNDWNNERLLNFVQTNVASSILNNEEAYGDLIIEVRASDVFNIIEKLRDDNSLKMNFLTLIGAVHYPERTNEELAVVYHLHSLVNNIRLRIKAFVPVSNPEIKSITPLYVGANWQERETFDNFGVIFTGHPNLKRILNEDSMDYHPLRKEYQLEDATREDKDDRFFGR